MELRIKKISALAMILAVGLFASVAGADDDYREGRERHGESRSSRAVKSVESALYKQECSSCHHLYQSWLLPARSWQAIMDESDKHEVARGSRGWALISIVVLVVPARAAGSGAAWPGKAAVNRWKTPQFGGQLGVLPGAVSSAANCGAGEEGVGAPRRATFVHRHGAGRGACVNGART